MVASISADHPTAPLQAWQQALPESVFAEEVAAIHGGLGAGMWDELGAAVPGLPMNR